MKNKMIKRIVLALLVCAMYLGNVDAVMAAEPEHVCAFSYMGKQSLGIYSAGTHAYVLTYEDGRPVYGTCTVQIERYVYVYKCACGETQRGGTSGRQIHSSCGQ
ncbi:MAG: hypothetical protein IJY10_09755 [Lachnospiraceae bacterium]|nr:hypothetical protein [Lachnospiraceae bacterium]